MINLTDYINKHIISEVLKVNSKSKVESNSSYTFDLPDYKETINLPFLLKIIGEEEEIKICKIDDVLKDGKHHIRLFDEKDKVAIIVNERHVLNFFKKYQSMITTVYNINGNAYYRNETVSIDKKSL